MQKESAFLLKNQYDYDPQLSATQMYQYKVLKIGPGINMSTRNNDPRFKIMQ